MLDLISGGGPGSGGGRDKKGVGSTVVSLDLSLSVTDCSILSKGVSIVSDGSGVDPGYGRDGDMKGAGAMIV